MDALARGSHLGYDGLSTQPSASGTGMCMHMPAHGMLMHMGTHGRRGQHANHAHSNAEQQQKAAAAGSSSTEQCPGIVPCQNFSADVIDTLTAKVNKVADLGFVYFVGVATVDVHVVG
jgi:hypothetical protein